jgi:spermidine synthase
LPSRRRLSLGAKPANVGAESMRSSSIPSRLALAVAADPARRDRVRRRLPLLLAVLGALAGLGLGGAACGPHRSGAPPADAVATSAPETGPESSAPSGGTGSSAVATARPSGSVVPSSTLKPGAKENIVFDETSPYGRVYVVDYPDRRCLQFSDGGEQSCMDMKAPEHVVHEYVRFMSVGLLFAKSAPRTLMVGLGGGSLVRTLLPHDPGMHMDVVELNPMVVDVAEKFFAIQPSDRLTIHVGDGREFIRKATSKWDLVLLDAYGDDYIPFPLTTVEFVRSVAEKLDPNGAVVSNVWYRNDKIFRAMIRTFHEVFPNIYVFKGIKSVNGIVVATRGTPALTCDAIKDKARAAAKGYGFNFDFQEPTTRCTTVEAYKLSDVPLLQDGKEDAFKALGAL